MPSTTTASARSTSTCCPTSTPTWLPNDCGEVATGRVDQQHTATVARAVAGGRPRSPTSSGGRHLPTDPGALARLLAALPFRTTATMPIDRAISTAGGVGLAEIDEHFMLHRLPGVFVAGEMLDWEAPTGGYLLQAAFSTGVAAAHGAMSRHGQGLTVSGSGRLMVEWAPASPRASEQGRECRTPSSMSWASRVVGLTRIELVTSSLSGMRSNRLSYSPAVAGGKASGTNADNSTGLRR